MVAVHVSSQFELDKVLVFNMAVMSSDLNLIREWIADILIISSLTKKVQKYIIGNDVRTSMTYRSPILIVSLDSMEYPRYAFMSVFGYRISSERVCIFGLSRHNAESAKLATILNF